MFSLTDCYSLIKVVWSTPVLDLNRDVFFFILHHLCLDVGSVEGLAYHRAWDTVYWTSSTTSSISRHTVDQNRHGAFRRQPVVTMSEDDHPHVLALDECQKSVIFWWYVYTLSKLPFTLILVQQLVIPIRHPKIYREGFVFHLL